jgi:tetratricopeptide (TPR) repeat protein
MARDRRSTEACFGIEAALKMAIIRALSILGQDVTVAAMQTLEPPNTHYLSAAMGWLELGNPSEAKQELARINPAQLNHPHVLEVNWMVHAAERDWPAALIAARALIQSDPDRSFGWLHQAYALRRVPDGGLQAAWNALFPVVDRFPKEPTIPYNLSCYACQMGQMEEARQWLRRALSRGDKATIKTMALADPDLKALWPEVKEW